MKKAWILVSNYVNYVKMVHAGAVSCDGLLYVMNHDRSIEVYSPQINEWSEISAADYTDGVVLGVTLITRCPLRF